MTPNRIVSHNLLRARELRGWTQEKAAEEIASYIGTRWSAESYAQAERARSGRRVRRFDLDELHAFARAFGLPFAFFLVPPSGAMRVHHAQTAPEQGESGVDFFSRVVALDDGAENAWLAKYLDDLPDTMTQRRRLQDVLDKRGLRATENAIMHELASLTHWSEQFQIFATQLEMVRQVAEAKATASRRKQGSGK